MKAFDICPCFDKITDTLDKGIDAVKNIRVHKKMNVDVDILSAKSKKSLYNCNINFDKEMSLPKALLIVFAIFFGISLFCNAAKKLYAAKVLKEYKKSQKEEKKEV